MTLLSVYTVSESPELVGEHVDLEEIQARLNGHGVAFDRWEVSPEFLGGGDSAAVLAAYAEQIKGLSEAEGYVMVDLVQLHAADAPEVKKAAREKFLAEHTHDDDEVRFFAGGSGVFYLHLGDQVLALLCTAGDLLSVPKDTTHWFDTGTDPDFTAVRFFHEEDGWIGQFTGSGISERFPSMDEIVARG